jgi:hypothetical protein
MGGNVMTKATAGAGFQKSSDTSSYKEIAEPVRNTCQKNSTQAVTWKQTILELSQKEGYTCIAL